MKLLVDTSVWLLALRRRDAASLSEGEQELRTQLTQAIQDGRVAMIGQIRQELLSGIKEQVQFDRVKNALDAFLDEQVDTEDYEGAALLYNACKSQRVEAGTVDMLICAVATRRNWRVLSNDAGLNRCCEIAKSFQEQSEKPPVSDHRKQRPQADRKTRKRRQLESARRRPE